MTKNSGHLLLLAVILCGAVLLRQYHIETKQVWYDEAISISHAEKAWDFYLSSFRVSYKPVYFALLHVWLGLFNENAVCLRFLSLFFGVLNIWILYRLCVTILSKETALISTFFLSVSVFHIFHCQQIRQFSLVSCLATLSVFFYCKFIKKQKLADLTALVLTNLALMYTYPTGFLILFIEFITALKFIRGEAKGKWWVGQFVLVLGGIFWWLLADKRQMTEMVWWINRPDVSSLIEVFQTFVWGGVRYGLDDFTAMIPFGGLMWLLEATYLFLLIVGMRNVFKGDRFVFLLVLWLLLPATFSFLGSIFSGVSVFAIKHLIISLPAFCVIVGIGWSALPRNLKIVIILLVAILNCIPLYAMYNYQFAVDWKQGAAYVKENIHTGDSVVISSLSEVVPFMFYFDPKKRTLADIDIYGKITRENYQNNVFCSSKGNRIIGIKQSGFGNKTVSSVQDFMDKIAKSADTYERPVWLMMSRWSEPGLKEYIETILTRRLERTSCVNFTGLEVCHFEPKGPVKDAQ